MATLGGARVSTKDTVTGSWREPTSTYRRLIGRARKELEAGNVAEAQRLFKLSEGFFGKDAYR